MPKANAPLLAFNRGIVSKRAMGRTDVERLRWAAEQQDNFVPDELGGMSLRPGLGYILNTGDRPMYVRPFAFAIDDTAALEFTDGQLRPLVDDAALTFADVTAAVTNGDMEPDLTGWTDADDAGAVSAYASTSGVLVSLSDRTIYDVRYGGDATAKFKLDADGIAYTMRNYYDGGVYQPVTAEWLRSGAAADYEHRATHVSGPALTSGTLGTWLSGGTDREWVKSTASTNGTLTTVLLIETRLIGTTATLAQAYITLKVTRETAGGGGSGGNIEP